jgi:23S rRNA pseudouridine1911/1915/1917 synthase
VEREFRRIVSPKMRGTRLDHYLILSGIGISRNQVTNLIDDGAVIVNARKTKPSYRVKAGDEILAQFMTEGAESNIAPEPMDLNIVYEDDDVIVIDKPRGVVVHPARGHPTGTLINGLLYHCKNLPFGPGSKIRPGVVHRLDKDTTGLLVFAKTDTSLTEMGHQVASRRVTRQYWALVWGNLALKRGEISAPIGRSTLDRKRMAVTPFASKEAVTTFEVQERFTIITYLRLALHTGRTHQIRVHLAHYGHPVVGDPEYGGRSKGLIANRTELPIYREVLKSIDRQALHAATLGFVHPRTKKYLEFNSPLPEDMDTLLRFLRTQTVSKKRK